MPYIPFGQFEGMPPLFAPNLVTADNIIGGTITAEELIIGGGTNGILRSQNYVPATDGWALFGDGSLDLNSLTLRGDLSSTNWDGTDPANLATIDSGATDGFYLDSSVGAAQYTGDMFIGGPGGDYLFLDATNWGSTTGIKWFRNSTEVGRIYATDATFNIQNVLADGGTIELGVKVGDTSYGTIINGGLEVATGFISTARGSATVPAYHFGSGGDNNTGMFSPAADQVSLVAGAQEQLRVSTAEVEFLVRAEFNGTDIQGVREVSGGDGSDGSPTYNFDSDQNTGMYRIGADDLGFSAGGQLGLSIDEPSSDAVSIRVNSSMERIDTGNSDSGGSGFRVLRVPN